MKEKHTLIKINNRLKKLPTQFKEHKYFVFITLLSIFVGVCVVLLIMNFYSGITDKTTLSALTTALTVVISMIGFSVSAYVFLNNMLQRKIVENPSSEETVNVFLCNKRRELCSLVLYIACVVIAEAALIFFDAPSVFISQNGFVFASESSLKPVQIFIITFILICLILTITFVIKLALFDYSIIDYEEGLRTTAHDQLCILNKQNANNNSTMNKSEFLTIVNNMETVLERMAQNHRNALRQSTDDSPILVALRARYEVSNQGDRVTDGTRAQRQDIADNYKKIIEYRNYLIMQNENIRNDEIISIGDEASKTINQIFSDCLTGELLSDINLTRLHVANANLEKTVFRNCSMRHIKFMDKSVLEGVDFRDSILNDVDLSSAKCKNINFSNARLIDVKLSPETELDNAIFKNADLTGLKNLGTKEDQYGKIKIKHANFARTNMIHMNIFNTVFDSSVMANIQLYDSKIGDSSLYENNTSFKFVNLQDAIMTNCKIVRSNFENANLARATLAYSQITKVNWNECRFDGATFTESVITDCQFEKTYCNNISMKGAKITDARFNNSTMISADFSNADLKNIHMDDSVCREALFVGTKINSSSFKRCIMSNVRIVSDENKTIIDKTNFGFANLSNSSISNINFINCDFTGADFSDVRLINVSFSNCVGIETIRFVDVWMDTVDLTQYNADGEKLRNASRYCRNVRIGDGKYLNDKILP